MTKLRFLCDEDTSWALVYALRAADPALDVIRVGEAGAPPRGTIDPDLLIAAEAMGRALISNDRSTLPSHLIAHFAAGRHTAGVILMRKGFALSRYVQKIVGFWAADEAEDWVDRTVYIP
jgi:hypothetical protein